MAEPALSRQPTGDQPPEDRLNGPGWNDWCYLDSTKTTAPDAWRGTDVINLSERHRTARDGWHRVICTRLHRRNGATLDELEHDENMAWFHLRLTRRETASLLWSAFAAGLAKRLGTDPASEDDVLAQRDMKWLWTDAAAEGKRYIEPQTGASGKDLLKHARSGSARARWISGVVASVAAAATAFVSQGVPGDNETLLYSTTGLLVLAVGCAGYAANAALREQGTLRAMIDAWPRAADYRHGRLEFEHMTLRSPMPWLVVVLVAAAALAAGVYLWHQRGEITTAAEQRGYAISIAIGAIAIVVSAPLGRRVLINRRAFMDEKGLRANPPRRTHDTLRPLSIY